MPDSGCSSGCLLVLDLSGSRVFSITPDGSDPKTLVTGCRLPDGLVVDSTAGYIYWTNMGVPHRNDGSIERADLDGGNRRFIIPEGGTFTPKQLHLEKKSGKALTDDELLAVVGREVKTRRESVEAFRKGGREDLAAKEEAEIAILGGYLPEQLDEAELAILVNEAIAATGAAMPRDLGKVMGWLSPRTRGRADGKRLSELVSARLAGAG